MINLLHGYKYLPFLLIVLFTANCRNKIAEAGKILDSDPASAIRILSQVEETPENSFILNYISGYAHDNAGNYENAMNFYVRALKNPESKDRDIFIKKRLHIVYNKLWEMKHSEEILQSAAALESETGMENNFASMMIFKRMKKQFDELSQNGKYQAAIEIASKANNLYLSADDKKWILEQATRLKPLKFKKEILDAISAVLIPELAGNGMYSADTRTFSFLSRLVVPTDQSEQFLQKQVCLPLYDKISELSVKIMKFSREYKLDDNKIKILFEKLWNFAKAGRDNSEYVCEISISLDDFLDVLYIVVST
jgi:tetratricopeptide (TPR) repeat protein